MTSAGESGTSSGLPSSRPRSQARFQNLSVGDVVFVGIDLLRGSLRYWGEAEFKEGEWFGIELDEPHGKNDGSVQGVRYFSCKPSHGIFVRDKHLIQAGPDGKPRRGSVARLSDASEAKSMTSASNKEQGLRPTVGIAASPESALLKDLSDTGSVCTTHRSSGATAPTSAKRALAEAVEDQDLDRVRQAIKDAEAAGICAKDLDVARRMLNFNSLHHSLHDDLAGVRSQIEDLQEKVQQAEARAEQAEHRAAATESRRRALLDLGHAGEDDGLDSDAFVEKLVDLLEGRVWGGLENRMGGIIEDVVNEAQRQLQSSIDEVRELYDSVGAVVAQAERQAREAPPMVLQSASDGREDDHNAELRSTFDDARGESAGLNGVAFKNAVRSCMGHFSEAQRDELWAAFLKRSNESLMDFGSFTTIMDALEEDAQGPTAAAVADKTVEEWQQLGQQKSRSVSFVDPAWRPRRRSNSLVTVAGGTEFEAVPEEENSTVDELQSLGSTAASSMKSKQPEFAQDDSDAEGAAAACMALAVQGANKRQRDEVRKLLADADVAVRDIRECYQRMDEAINEAKAVVDSTASTVEESMTAKKSQGREGPKFQLPIKEADFEEDEDGVEEEMLAIVRPLFKHLQPQQSLHGCLGPDELRTFASKCGFEGDGDRWEQEYGRLAAKFGWGDGDGISLRQFAKYIKEEELLKHMPTAAS